MMSSFSTLGFNPKYDDKKEENMIYVGKNISNNQFNQSYRNVSSIIPEEKGFISEKNAKIEETQRNFFHKGDESFVSEKVNFDVVKSLTLYTSPSGQQKFACWLLKEENSSRISGLHISRRTKNGVYSNEEITLSTKGIVALKNFLNTLPIIDIGKTESYKFLYLIILIKIKKF